MSGELEYEIDQVAGVEHAKIVLRPGVTVMSGANGCGKTSTLAALVNLINQERPDHILTAEEPIEYVQTSRRALVNQREIGTHSESFARMLRGALREVCPQVDDFRLPLLQADRAQVLAELALVAQPKIILFERPVAGE